jgi:hypothetical protein
MKPLYTPPWAENAHEVPDAEPRPWSSLRLLVAIAVVTFSVTVWLACKLL